MNNTSFKEFLTAEPLSNAKLAYSVKGSAMSKDKLSWSMQKQKLIIADIKKHKPVKAYRTYSLSENTWNKLFNSGYTEIGNINIEHGLTSFTLDKKMMNRFAGGGTITIRIEVILNKYSEILETSIHPEEQEILGYDIKWKVIDIDDSQASWYIKGEQI